MKNYHLNVRRYDQPMSLLIYEKTILNGVVKYSLKQRIEIKGSAMETNSTDLSNNNRADNSTISIIIPNPPFELFPETTKIIIRNQLYAINRIDFNWLTYGEIKLIAIYQQPWLEITNSSLEFGLEGGLSG